MDRGFGELNIGSKIGVCQERTKKFIVVASWSHWHGLLHIYKIMATTLVLGFLCMCHDDV